MEAVLNAAAPTASQRSTMIRILAVDDSAMIRQMMTNILHAAGYEVLLADDGNQALEMARHERLDLVISDVNMPGLDGISLVRELRQLEAYRLVPLLLLTTESSTEKKQQAKAAGATGWIVKPFNTERLLGAISKVLG
jgi:two-component system chemotaxis response regulator CheY